MTTSTIDVPMFLQKLHSILSHDKFQDIVSWSHNAKMFVIKDEEKLATEVLPMFYKHSNLNSFVRQLHMYGFKKFKQGTCQNAYYYHKYFFKNESEMMAQIKRKLTSQQKRDQKAERNKAGPAAVQEVHLSQPPKQAEKTVADSGLQKPGQSALRKDVPTFMPSWPNPADVRKIPESNLISPPSSYMPSSKRQGEQNPDQLEKSSHTLESAKNLFLQMYRKNMARETQDQFTEAVAISPSIPNLTVDRPNIIQAGHQ